MTLIQFNSNWTSNEFPNHEILIPIMSLMKTVQFIIIYMCTCQVGDGC